MTDLNFIKKDDREIFNYHDERIPYLSFKCFDELNIVKNAVTLRNTSEGDPVRLFLVGGADIKDVTGHNNILLSELGTNPSHLVKSQQKHTNNVHVVTEDDLGKDISGTHILNTDGLVTDIPGAVLSICVADCTPLMFVDPVNCAIGIAHSGRKGTFSSIGSETVNAMVREFGSEPSDIIASVGPGICEECYEVGDEIYDELCSCWGPFLADRLMKRRGDRYHLDLLLANKLVLLDSGIKSENIYVSNICNRCNCDKMYSYRGDGGIINETGVYLMLL